MSALPSHQQSLAGGIFNMLIRLGTTIAIGISTAVFSSVEQTRAAEHNIIIPYKRAFDVGIGLAGLGCLFVPFLRLGTQGNAKKVDATSEEPANTSAVLRSDSGGETEKSVDPALANEKL